LFKRQYFPGWKADMTHDIQAPTAKERSSVPRCNRSATEQLSGNPAAHHEHAFEMEARYHEERAPAR
jgi:hypothetical protein